MGTAAVVEPSTLEALKGVLAKEFEDAVWNDGSPHPEVDCCRF